MGYTTADLYRMNEGGMNYPQIADLAGLTLDQARGRVRRYRAAIAKAGVQPAQQQPRLSASPMPRYDKPLTIEGDALILNDLEVPFHEAEFVNRCLDLSHAWGITNLVLGGDIMHFETLSAWGAAWQEEKPAVDTMSEETEKEWRMAIEQLPPEHQAVMLEKLTRMIANRDCANDEIKAGAKALKTLAQIFKQVGYVLGNHDDRFLRKLQAPMTPQKLLNFLGLTEPCWNIAPYFYGVLTSGGERWRIEHQRSAAPNAAIRLADKNETNTIIAHNHVQSLQWSTSGRYYAISSGCACDESRMFYAAARSSQRPAHALGAVIIRDGYPYVLHPRVDWARLARMA